MPNKPEVLMAVGKVLLGEIMRRKAMKKKTPKKTSDKKPKSSVKSNLKKASGLIKKKKKESDVESVSDKDSYP